MNDTTLNLILEAAFIGLPALMTIFFAAWLLKYEYRKGA